MNEWLRKTAAGQHGLLSRTQLLGHLTEPQLQWWVSTRRLEPVRPGVYKVAGAPESWEQQLHACCISAGSGVFASHRSAGRLWGLSGVPAQRLEVTAGADRPVRLTGVLAHRSNLLDDRFVTDLDGIPLTTPERTIVDLSAVLGEMTLGRIVDDAVRSGVVSYSSVRECVEQMRRRGRRRTTVVDGLLDARSGMDPGESHLEARVSRWLKEAGLPRPVSQHWAFAGGKRFRLDLAYPDQRWGSRSTAGGSMRRGTPSTVTARGGTSWSWKVGASTTSCRRQPERASCEWHARRWRSTSERTLGRSARSERGESYESRSWEGRVSRGGPGGGRAGGR